LLVCKCAALAVGWLGRHGLPPFRRDGKHANRGLGGCTRSWPDQDRRAGAQRTCREVQRIAPHRVRAFLVTFSLFLNLFCFNLGRNSRATHLTVPRGVSPLGRLGLSCSRSRHKNHARKNVCSCGVHVLTTIKIFSFSSLYSLRSGRSWYESLHELASASAVRPHVQRYPACKITTAFFSHLPLVRAVVVEAVEARPGQ
jgi:hypothetical protein